MSDCLFCKIVAGEIPATVVEETATTVAFRDIAPVSPTHVLVIPRLHVATLAEAVALDPAIAADVMAGCTRVAEAEGVAADGYRVVINSGAHGGQMVHHLHAHVLGGRPHAWPPG